MLKAVQTLCEAKVKNGTNIRRLRFDLPFGHKKLPNGIIPAQSIIKIVPNGITAGQKEVFRNHCVQAIFTY